MARLIDGQTAWYFIYGRTGKTHFSSRLGSWIRGFCTTPTGAQTKARVFVATKRPWQHQFSTFNSAPTIAGGWALDTAIDAPLFQLKCWCVKCPPTLYIQRKGARRLLMLSRLMYYALSKPPYHHPMASIQWMKERERNHYNCSIACER
jgi:hypothetical protein